MPTPLIKTLATKSGKTEDKVEQTWSKIKDSLKDQGHSESDDNFYPILVGAVKNALKINESLSFKEFNESWIPEEGKEVYLWYYTDKELEKIMKVFKNDIMKKHPDVWMRDYFNARPKHVTIFTPKGQTQHDEISEYFKKLNLGKYK